MIVERLYGGQYFTVFDVLQVRGYNDGGWFTLFRTFGEETNQGPPIFFKTLGLVSVLFSL